jgi:hypothetical protein
VSHRGDHRDEVVQFSFTNRAAIYTKGSSSSTTRAARATVGIWTPAVRTIRTTWRALDERSRRDVIAYIKTFSPRFATEKPQDD